MADQVETKKRIALFVHTVHNFTSVFAQGLHTPEEDAYLPNGYARISEWQDVEFAVEGIDKNALKLQALNAQEDAIRAEATKQLGQIQAARDSILAATSKLQ